LELTQWKERLASIINQYKYVLLLIAAGIILLMFPANEKPEKQGISQQQENIITVEQHEKSFAQHCAKICCANWK